MDDRDYREISENVSETKERVARLEAGVEYIKQSVDELKDQPCKKQDEIATNRRMITVAFIMLAGLVSYLTGIKLVG